MNGKGGELIPPINQRGEQTMSLLQVLQEELGLTIDEAKELIKQFDYITGNSLNAVKNSGVTVDGDDKKKKFWK